MTAQNTSLEYLQFDLWNAYFYAYGFKPRGDIYSAEQWADREFLVTEANRLWEREHVKD